MTKLELSFDFAHFLEIINQHSILYTSNVQ